MTTVLITGATGLIGTEVCRYLLSKGWKIVVSSREIGKGKKLEKELKKLGRVSIVEMDLLDSSSLDRAVSDIKSRGIKISHLVNCARSINTLSVNEFGMSDNKSLVEEMQLAVFAPYKLICKLAKDFDSMTSIVNISSQYGLVVPNPLLYDEGLKNSPVSYGLSKAALNHLTKELAVRLCEKKIRVNAIAFGGFEGRADHEFVKRYSQFLPLGRMLKLEEAGPPVEFLLGKGSNSINGHVLVADGGWTII